MKREWLMAILATLGTGMCLVFAIWHRDLFLMWLVGFLSIWVAIAWYVVLSSLGWWPK